MTGRSRLNMITASRIGNDTRRARSGDTPTMNAAAAHTAQEGPELDPTPIFEIFRGSYGTELLTASVSHLRVFDHFRDGPLPANELLQPHGRPSLQRRRIPRLAPGRGTGARGDHSDPRALRLVGREETLSQSQSQISDLRVRISETELRGQSSDFGIGLRLGIRTPTPPPWFEAPLPSPGRDPRSGCC